MRLESYSITGISPCLALPKMNDMDVVGCLIYVSPLASHMYVRVCTCA